MVKNQLVLLVGLAFNLDIWGAGWQVLDFEQAFPQSKLEQLFTDLGQICFSLDYGLSGDQAVQQLIVERLQGMLKLIPQLNIDRIWPDDLRYLVGRLHFLQQQFDRSGLIHTPLIELILQLFKRVQIDLMACLTNLD